VELLKTILPSEALADFFDFGAGASSIAAGSTESAAAAPEALAFFAVLSLAAVSEIDSEFGGKSAPEEFSLIDGLEQIPSSRMANVAMRASVLDMLHISLWSSDWGARAHFESDHNPTIIRKICKRCPSRVLIFATWIYMALNLKHNYPGKLVVVEGVDGSGKSTQLNLLKNWLEDRGQKVIFTEWNSSKLISKTIKEAKRSNSLIPVTFSLLHATDFADRLENIIKPALKAGFTVLADRYCYTAFARDVARGVDRDWVRNLYEFSIRPDAGFYFQVPIEVSLERIATSRQPGFYESGMDIGLSSDPKQSFHIFQSRIINEYDQMVQEFGLNIMPATASIHEQQVQFRQKVGQLFFQRS